MPVATPVLKSEFQFN